MKPSSIERPKVARFRSAHLACLVALLTLWVGCQSATQSSEPPHNPDIEVKSKWPYDHEVVIAVQKRWYDLLKHRRITPIGEVVVEFNLRVNGTVDQLKVIDSTVGELFVEACQRAIQDSAPFRRWPREMRDELKSDVREIRFTFRYK